MIYCTIGEPKLGQALRSKKRGAAEGERAEGATESAGGEWGGDKAAAGVRVRRCTCGSPLQQPGCGDEASINTW